jgi:hypothetical protein
MTTLAVGAPLAVTTPVALEPVVAANPTDLDRLRSLIQATASQTANPLGSSAAMAETTAATGGKTLGDSILQGVLRFGDHYQHSMQAIDTRVQEIMGNEAAGLNNFSDLIALQIDVSKWTMPVMGVDNASKAGANTIKELSKGG